MGMNTLDSRDIPFTWRCIFEVVKAHFPLSVVSPSYILKLKKKQQKHQHPTKTTPTAITNAVIIKIVSLYCITHSLIII